MKHSFAAVVVLVMLWTNAEAQAKRLQATQIYGFGEVEEGRWVAVPLTDLPRYLNASRIECSATKTKIDITWRSQSGDWAIFDTYSTTAPFFDRAIKLAQSDQTITVKKRTPGAEPSVHFGGEEIRQYDFLLEEFPTKLTAQDFPFALPQCARGLFGTP